jgi:hypothetical protein
MNAALAPLHTATIHGLPVRFFRAGAGAAEIPWHALDDVARVLGLHGHLREQLVRMTCAALPGATRTMPLTSGELVTIAPQHVGVRLIQVAAQCAAGIEMFGGVDPRLPALFELAHTEALIALTGEPSPSSHQG